MNLIKKVAEYRKLMNKQCGITTEHHYVRVFTDPRKNGVRSKYYQCSDALPVKMMKKFVSAYPSIEANGTRYSIELDTAAFDKGYYGQSVSLKFNSIK